jgi:hypothetical protein
MGLSQKPQFTILFKNYITPANSIKKINRGFTNQKSRVAKVQIW